MDENNAGVSPVLQFDPVLRDRRNEPARQEAWLRDQYPHPEEHRHTLAEVQGWFEENDAEYLRAYPSALGCGYTWLPSLS